MLTDIKAARDALEVETYTALLAAAARILSEQGLAALTVRHVAQAVNVSTKMIYTHFGGKDGLLDALYVHSFAGLTRAFEAEHHEKDPAARLYRMTIAYREFALAEPALYNVMFGDLGRAWEAPAPSRKQAWRSFTAFRDTVRLCLPNESAEDALASTYLLWAAMHGVVSLELRMFLGSPGDGGEIFKLAVEAICKARHIVIK